MAGIAAAALAVEQVVATGLEAGAAVVIAKPSQPLKVSLTQIQADTAETSEIIARTNHTVTVIGNRAHIFGGQRGDGSLFPNEVHAATIPPDPSSTSSPAHGDSTTHASSQPAFLMNDAATGATYVPSPRVKHAATRRGTQVVIHGGSDDKDQPITSDEATTVWLWDTASLRWSRINGVVPLGKNFSQLRGHSIFHDESTDQIVLHGGSVFREGRGWQPNEETWVFSFQNEAWAELPPAPIGKEEAVAFVDGALYVLSAASGEAQGKENRLAGGAVHILRLGKGAREQELSHEWETVEFPANPLVPGPRLRGAGGGALVPLRFGLGRTYLAYLFGSGETGKGEESNAKLDPYSADIWILQLPSVKLSGAGIKDAIREKLPRVESGEMSWVAADVVPTELAGKTEGKAHPGPRAFFGADVVGGGGQGDHAVVLFGGRSARGVEADGWRLRFW